jgi:hypothetical protein
VLLEASVPGPPLRAYKGLSTTGRNSLYMLKS